MAIDYFKNVDFANFHDENFAFLLVEEQDHVLTITLDREKKRNAIHPQTLNELAYAFQYASGNNKIWMIVIQAKGEVFCAGADLKAFAGFVEEHNSTIPKTQDNILIGELFNKVHKPTITKVTGDVYAGGFFFLAGANIVIAQDNIKLVLSEVKRGLYPFQVMSSLMEVMPNRKVVDWCIRGYNLPVQEAVHYGLITQLVAPNTIDAIRGPLSSIEIVGDQVKGSEWEGSTAKETLQVTYAGTSNGERIEPVPASDDSPVLLIGDSHTLVFSEGGDMHTKAAGLRDHLQAEFGYPLAHVGVRGSGLVQARRQLYQKAAPNPTFWESKKLVVWTFSVREFTQSFDKLISIPIEKKK